MNIRHNEKRMYTTKEAADILGVHKNTVYTYVREDRIKHVIIGRKIAIPAAELERILREGMSR